MKRGSWVTGMCEKGRTAGRGEEGRKERNKVGRMDGRREVIFTSPLSLCSTLPALHMFYDTGSGSTFSIATQTAIKKCISLVN